MTDESRAPAGSKGRPRRSPSGLHRRPATSMRFQPELAAALEREARETGRSKIGIVEELLTARYQLEAA